MDKDYSTLLSGAIRTSFFHQAVTLISRASFAFAVLWILLLTTSFWFRFNAEQFGVLAVIVSIVFTHFFLIAAESNFISKVFYFLRKGRPLLIYRRWLAVNDTSIVFGNYRVLWSAIDSVSLSYLGNLIFTSRALCGPPVYGKNGDDNPAAKVLRLPFSAIDLRVQKLFVAQLKEKCPQAVLSPSLIKVLNKPVFRSTSYIHLLTSSVFLFILFDVGYSTFRYVELLKRYYLADEAAICGDLQKAKKQYEFAEELRINAVPFSTVSKQLLSKGQSLSVVQEARARVLWKLGKKEEALRAQQEAASLMPKTYKIVLRQARFCIELGKIEEAKKVIKGLIEKHRYALLPHLYFSSLLWQNDQLDEAKQEFKRYLDQLDNEYFSPPPVWPASGEEALHELLYRDDLKFLFPDKVMSVKPSVTLSTK